MDSLPEEKHVIKFDFGYFSGNGIPQGFRRVESLSITVNTDCEKTKVIINHES